jgi:cytoskeletal protein CcmA (bactofilin family)
MSLFSNEPEKSAIPKPPAPKIVAPPSIAAASSVPAFLDRGTKINGKLRFEGAARIDGTVDGELDGKEITIGESGVATAQIRGDSIVVHGKVKGEITATNRIEIHPTAKVIGNIAAPKLIIHDGAIFEGQCSMGQEADRERKVRAVS